MSSRYLRSALVLFPLVLGTIVGMGGCGDNRPGFDPVDPVDAGPAAPPLVGNDAGEQLPDPVACLSDTVGAVPVPLAMLIVMDRSASMDGDKWNMARQAMISFADTPGPVASKLGLTVFPPDQDGIDCSPMAYEPIVPIALLPGNGGAIKDALLSRVVKGGTPMMVALMASVDTMKSFLGANPDNEGVIILVTDGDPNICSSSVETVGDTAAAAVNGSPKIRTFVVGMEGATFKNLDKIAVAGGGTPKAFNASGGADAGLTPQQQLLDALEAIRSGAMGCEYVLPRPDPSQGTLDPASVEMDFTPAKNDAPQKFQRVDNEAACGATTGGFFYDDPKNPTRIILCPASCEATRNGSRDAKMDVVMGCIKQVN